MAVYTIKNYYFFFTTLLVTVLHHVSCTQSYYGSVQASSCIELQYETHRSLWGPTRPSYTSDFIQSHTEVGLHMINRLLLEDNISVTQCHKEAPFCGKWSMYCSVV